jgi:hypothetical protein
MFNLKYKYDELVKLVDEKFLLIKNGLSVILLINLIIFWLLGKFDLLSVIFSAKLV